MNLTDSVPEENLNPKKLSKKYYLVEKVNNNAWKDYSIMTMS